MIARIVKVLSYEKPIYVSHLQPSIGNCTGSGIDQEVCQCTSGRGFRELGGSNPNNGGRQWRLCQASIRGELRSRQYCY